MKSTRDFRAPAATEDMLRKAAKLEPIRKSGKERHQLYEELDDDLEMENYQKKESVLDYFDDGEEE